MEIIPHEPTIKKCLWCGKTTVVYDPLNATCHKCLTGQSNLDSFDSYYEYLERRAQSEKEKWG